MRDVTNNLSIYNNFLKIKAELTLLLKYNIIVEIIELLILFTETYDVLSVIEIQETEEKIDKLAALITNNKDLPIEFKQKLLNNILSLKKLCVDLTINTIIDSI